MKLRLIELDAVSISPAALYAYRAALPALGAQIAALRPEEIGDEQGVPLPDGSLLIVVPLLWGGAAKCYMKTFTIPPGQWCWGGVN